MHAAYFFCIPCLMRRPSATLYPESYVEPDDLQRSKAINPFKLARLRLRHGYSHLRVNPIIAFVARLTDSVKSTRQGDRFRARWQASGCRMRQREVSQDHAHPGLANSGGRTQQAKRGILPKHPVVGAQRRPGLRAIPSLLLLMPLRHVTSSSIFRRPRSSWRNWPGFSSPADVS